MFPNPCIKQFWCHQICKLYQNRLLFVTVFETYCNFFTVLPIQLKTCRSNGFFCFFFFFCKAKCAHPIFRARFYFLLYIFLYIRRVLRTLIFAVSNWLLYIIQLLHIIIYSLGIVNIRRIEKSNLLVGLIWEE